jgi:hypothetical protein
MSFLEQPSLLLLLPLLLLLLLQRLLWLLLALFKEALLASQDVEGIDDNEEGVEEKEDEGDNETFGQFFLLASAVASLP